MWWLPGSVRFPTLPKRHLTSLLTTWRKKPGSGETVTSVDRLEPMCVAGLEGANMLGQTR